MNTTNEKSSVIERKFSSKNYLTLLPVEGDYITQENCHIWLSQKIPPLLNFLSKCIELTDDKIGNEALKIIHDDMELITRLAAFVASLNVEIPVVFEGYQLSSNHNDYIYNLMNTFLYFICESEAVDLDNREHVEVYRELLVTRDRLADISTNEQLGEEETDLFLCLRANKVKQTA